MMKDTSFQIGDVVYLKSGSFPMTVSGFDEEICCVAWYHDGGIVGMHRFHPEMLCLTVDPGIMQRWLALNCPAAFDRS